VRCERSPRCTTAHFYSVAGLSRDDGRSELHSPASPLGIQSGIRLGSVIVRVVACMARLPIGVTMAALQTVSSIASIITETRRHSWDTFGPGDSQGVRQSVRAEIRQETRRCSGLDACDGTRGPVVNL
jgi:hypothetical protein